MNDAATLVKDLGLPIALVVFFVLQAYWREKKFDVDNAAQRKFIEDTLVSLLRDSTATHKETTAALSLLSTVVKESNEVHRSMQLHMMRRPCLLDGKDGN